MARRDLEKIDMTRPRVRYNGEVLDKCSLSGLIHDVAFMAGNTYWPIWSDIYWYSATYKELVSYAIEWINRYNSQNDEDAKRCK